MEKLIEINKEGYIAFNFYDLVNLLENTIYQEYYKTTGETNDYLDEIISNLLYEYMEKIRYGKFSTMKEASPFNF